jgi:Subtilase family
VIGVSALTRSGNVPDYSNRDAIYNDIAAPGSSVYSTFPLALTAERPTCVDQGYSDCGTDDYRDPEGTSFAAPQVSGAAAVLFAIAPTLTNSQAETILEHSADDVNAGTGCSKCQLLRDPYTGWGRLDIAKAVAQLTAALPAVDRYETNDDAGSSAYTLWGKHVKIGATADYYDDPVDVYRVALGPREKLSARVTGSWAGAQVNLVLWKPATQKVDDARKNEPLRAAQSASPGSSQHMTFTARARGWYYVEVKVGAPGFGAYTLSLDKSTK